MYFDNHNLGGITRSTSHDKLYVQLQYSDLRFQYNSKVLLSYIMIDPGRRTVTKSVQPHVDCETVTKYIVTYFSQIKCMNI